MTEFREFQKIPRLSRDCVITEKIDGTNGCIFIGDDGEFLVGSRSRWITPAQDNFGFATWATEHREELLTLGPGFHYGEWWGLGIQRRYGQKEKRWSLFNVSRWGDDAVRPKCCGVVPVLASGIFNTVLIQQTLDLLHNEGSKAAPGFMKPEGVVIYHTQGRLMFKKTLEKDTEWKGKSTAPRQEERP